MRAKLIWFALALAPLVLAGCGTVPRPEPPHVPEHARAIAGAEPSSDSPAAPVESDDPHHFRLAWQRQLPPFNQGLALAPSGLLAVLASRRLSLYQLRGGQPLGESDVCFSAAAGFAFVAISTGALVCEDAIKLYTLPKLTYLGRKSLAGKARLVAAGGTFLAIAFDGGPVRVYDVGDWKVVREVAVPARATALAIAADGSAMAIGLDSGDAMTIALGDAGAPHTIKVKIGLPVGAVAFSSAGDRLFAAAGPALTVFDREGHEMLAFHVAQQVTAAHWLGDHDVAVIAEETLLLLDTSDGSAHGVPWTGAAPEHLATFGDKGVLCAASHDGAVACLSHGSLPAVQTLPLAQGPGAPGAQRMAGRVSGLTGARLHVKPQPGAPIPASGSEVLILRYREKTLASDATWTETARGKIADAHDDALIIELHDAALPSATSASGHMTIPPDVSALVYDTAVEIVWPPGEGLD